jgi:hypothetical protein
MLRLLVGNRRSAFAKVVELLFCGISSLFSVVSNHGLPFGQPIVPSSRRRLFGSSRRQGGSG